MRKCPLCKRGEVYEDALGEFCSRRYAKQKRWRCDWQGENVVVKKDVKLSPTRTKTTEGE